MPDLIAGLGSVLFHGTTAARLESIMERGLEPRRPGDQKRGFELGDLLGSFLERRGVYLTDVLPLARGAGRGASDAVVLTVDVAGLPVFEQRLWMPSAPWGWPIDQSGAIVVYGCPERIPPERITRWGERPHRRLERGRVSFEPVE
jgi:hypothetical protein